MSKEIELLNSLRYGGYEKWQYELLSSEEKYRIRKKYYKKKKILLDPDEKKRRYDCKQRNRKKMGQKNKELKAIVRFLVDICKVRKGSTRVLLTDEQKKANAKAYRLRNKDRINSARRLWSNRNRDKINERNRLLPASVKSAKRKKAKLNNPILGVRENLRKRIRQVLKANKWSYVGLKSTLVGCSGKFLRLHLEAQFTEGMSWENYGKWHIDHVIPLSSAKTKEEMELLCHYTNLQPLWALENIKKSNKIPAFISPYVDIY